MPGFGQRHPGIDHAEPGAQDHHCRIGIERGIARRAGADGDALAAGGLRLVAHGQHGPAADEAGAIGEDDLDAGFGRVQRLGFLGEDAQPPRHGRTGLAQHLLEIDAIEPAGHEDPGTGMPARFAPLQPAPEMLGIVGEGAHAAGRHVDAMLALQRRIGEALAEAALPFDERDAQVRIGAAEQVGSEDDAAGAAADDDDGGAAHRAPSGVRR